MNVNKEKLNKMYTHIIEAMCASAILLNTSWKSCFVTVFSTACDSYSTIFIVSKWLPFSFIFNRGNRGKSKEPRQASRIGKERQSCCQNFLGEKGSVRWCVVVKQQPVLLSPKFGAKSSHIFMQSP
jgi:hypothetical protein